jgi:hypothetical protein
MFKIRDSLFSVFISLLILYSCSNQQKNVQDLILSVKDHFAPDSRTAVFDLECGRDAGEYFLTGETDSPRAITALLDSLERLNIAYRNMIQILPDEQSGGRTWAIINVSVSNMRKDPRHSSELVNQANLGTMVKVLKKENGWYLIQTPDRYIGWVDGGGIETKFIDEINEYMLGEKIIFTGIYGFSYQEPAEGSTKVSDLTSGNILFLEEIYDFHYKVSYPDGRLAYVSKSDAEVFSEWVRNFSRNGESLTSAATDLLGVPYLWGGTSPKAMDCSGFTKTVYLLNGLMLPRDADQQASIGTLIDDKKNFEALKNGDLLFFGKPATDSSSERIVHVGMWIGEMKFIHASGDVHTSSIDPASPLFDEYNLNRYLRTKRLIGSGDENKISVKTGLFETW